MDLLPYFLSRRPHIFLHAIDLTSISNMGTIEAFIFLCYLIEYFELLPHSEKELCYLMYLDHISPV